MTDSDERPVVRTRCAAQPIRRRIDCINRVSAVSRGISRPYRLSCSLGSVRWGKCQNFASHYELGYEIS